MERTMFELVPTDRGWRLDEGDRPGHCFADRDLAIAAADRSARLRHQLGRHPTGVQVKIEDEWVLVASYG